MFIKEDRFETEFIEGEDYFLPFDLDTWAMSAPDRMNWAKKRLAEWSKPLKDYTFLCIRRNKDLIPEFLVVRNFNSKQ